MSLEKFPRLSQTLPHARKIGTCQACGESDAGINLWHECDDQDNPEMIYLELCETCNKSRDEYGNPNRKGTKKSMIVRHERMYHPVNENAWIPGLMHLCANCDFAKEFACTHPLKGQKVLNITGPKPFTFHVKAGRGMSGWYTNFQPATSCSGQRLKTNP